MGHNYRKYIVEIHMGCGILQKGWNVCEVVTIMEEWTQKCVALLRWTN